MVMDEKQVRKADLKRQLLAALAAQEEKVIVLRAQKSVPIDEVVYVMNIANQNAVKVVLAVDAQ